MAAAKKHGTSTYIQSDHKLMGEAEFYDFAPSCCSCFAGCTPDSVRARTYAHIYDNKLEMNVPIAPFGPCTTELCIIDRVFTMYHDKPPFRSGLCMCCCCIPIPCTCCGEPVIFAESPKCCCCIDLKDCCGQQIKAAPHKCFGLKCCLCCGSPCYERGATPLVTGMKDPEKFLKTYQEVIEAYKSKTGLKAKEMVIFPNVANAPAQEKMGAV